jgi:hypothetical protein
MDFPQRFCTTRRSGCGGLSVQAKASRLEKAFRTNLFEISAQVKSVSEFLQTHGPGKLRHRPNPLLPSLSQTFTNVLYATARQKRAATLHSQKDFRGTNTHPDRPRILRNRRASSCDPAPRIWDFAPRHMKRCSFSSGQRTKAAVPCLHQIQSHPRDVAPTPPGGENCNVSSLFSR